MYLKRTILTISDKIELKPLNLREPPKEKQLHILACMKIRNFVNNCKNKNMYQFTHVCFANHQVQD